jgi:metallophosphoesterase (TIGR00282 family)
MNILFLGDCVGRSGRDAVVAQVPDLRKKLDLDLVIVNGENAAGGFGITADICKDFYAAGVDVVSGGNHSWDQPAIVQHIGQDPRLLRPINQPGAPGRGATTVELRGGRKALIVNCIGQVFMDSSDNPFHAVSAELDKVTLGRSVAAVVIDIHAEATSEKAAMGVFADGRASMVVGSHSHVPSADARILPGGTAFQSDAGMCGDYDSIIGMTKEGPLDRFLGKVVRARFSPALGEATLCGVFVQTDDATGRATRIAPLRQGGKLAPAWPAGF